MGRQEVGPGEMDITHFQVHTFTSGVYRKVYAGFIVEQTHFCPLLQHLYSGTSSLL